MIAVFMRDQNGIQVSDIFPDRGQTFRDLTAAQAGINEYARAIRGDERRVARARRCENADLKDGEPRVVGWCFGFRAPFLIGYSKS